LPNAINRENELPRILKINNALHISKI